MPFVLSVFRTEEMRIIRGLINEFKFKMKCKRVSEICSMCVI